jgi:glutamate carboxypeptidase
MDPLLSYMNKRLPAIIGWIGELVRIESPSGDREAVNRAMEFVADRVSPHAKVKRYREKAYGDHLRIEFNLPGKKKSGQILGIGHLDTVYPIGALKRMPFKRSKGRLWGPGVFDMKAGVAYYVFACEALRQLDVPVKRRFVLQLNSDEEVGSPTSRRHTEKEARRSVAALVTEPSAGPNGDAKTARKGGGGYTIRVKGIASHAGLDFASGASAIVELSRQLVRLSEWTDLDKGITLNPGLIHGGTATNVVAEEASATVDVRVPRRSQARSLEKRFEALKPFDKRTKLAVEGSIRRPPMERDQGIAKLFRLAQRLSRELGVELGETQVGGGSDGNFTAALGVPTLDGIGAVGEGAHALHENIRVDRIADRAALIAKLIAAI